MLRVSLRQLFDKTSMPTPQFFATDEMTLRPEQLSVAQFVALTNLVAPHIRP